MKHIKFTLFILLLIFSSVLRANAADQQTDSLPIDSGIAVLLVIGLIIGIKIVLKKLKQVDKDLHDAFGEKVL